MLWTSADARSRMLQGCCYIHQIKTILSSSEAPFACTLRSRPPGSADADTPDTL